MAKAFFGTKGGAFGAISLLPSPLPKIAAPCRRSSPFPVGNIEIFRQWPASQMMSCRIYCDFDNIQAIPSRPTMRVNIFDNGLRGRTGHHFDFCLNLAKSFRARGCTVQVHGAIGAEANVSAAFAAADCPFVPLFSHFA